MSKVVIYGKSMCIYCQDAKDYFESINENFEYIETSDEKLVELEKENDIDTVPQIYINGKFIGGWITTKSLIDNGELNKLLK